MNPGQLMQLATGYWASSVLNTGVELGVFQALAEPRSAHQLALELGCELGYLERLLDAMVGLELLTAAQGKYRIPESLLPYLGPGAASSLEEAIHYNHDLFGLWGQLGRCIREGHPVQAEGRHLGADPASTRRFVLGMESRGRMLAPAIVDALPPPNGSRVLDLACGSGVISRLLAQKYMELKITLFDFPAVLDITRELWNDSPGEPEFIPGSYRKDELPPGRFDYILYCGALHQESNEGAAALFDKVYSKLAPGGIFCIVDFLLEEDRSSPVFSALFSLNMMLIQPDGYVFSCGDVQTQLSRAGFTSIRTKALAAGPYGMIVAQKGIPQKF